jgi:hypothetical protein
MAHPSNAKYSREEPLLVWRYSYRYGNFDGKKDPNTLNIPKSRKKIPHCGK